MVKCIVPSSKPNPYDYAVYPSFEHWAFPHANLPPTWVHCAAEAAKESNSAGLAPPSASNITDAILRRDGSCRVTSGQDYVERAHLCPRSQAAWFSVNGMIQYNQNKSLSGDYIMDDVCNAMALRSDIHKAFDDGKFVCVPKESRWVVHFLDLTNTLGPFYHNTVLELDPSISLLLLARFAWSVFPFIHQFLKVGVARNLRLRVAEEGKFKEVTKTVTGEEITAMGPAIRGRDRSPKKRRAATETAIAASRTIKRQRLSSPLDGTAQDSSQDANFLAPEQHSQSPVSHADRTLDLGDESPATTPSPDPPSPRAHALRPPDPDLSIADSSCDIAQWIRSRRPSNPDLYCCDYNRAEAEVRKGLPGKKEFGGAHLCLECLGVEYRDADEDEGCT